LNKWPEPTQPTKNASYFDRFSECVHYITHRSDLQYGEIEGNHPIPTTAGEAPKAADVLTALQAGYRWTSPPGRTSAADFKLTNEFKIPAWLSRSLKFENLHAEAILKDLWPVPHNYFYVELHNDAGTNSICPPEGKPTSGL